MTKSRSCTVGNPELLSGFHLYCVDVLLAISGTVDDCTMHNRETIALCHAYYKRDNYACRIIPINLIKPFLKTEPCSTGEFYSAASNSCVIECPCGMYGDMQTDMCKQGTLFMVTGGSRRVQFVQGKNLNHNSNIPLASHNSNIHMPYSLFGNSLYRVQLAEVLYCINSSENALKNEISMHTKVLGVNSSLARSTTVVCWHIVVLYNYHYYMQEMECFSIKIF